MSVYEHVFNPAEPCPDSIQNCEEIRARYLEDAQRLNQSGCKSCDELRLKSEYITEIWKAYMAKLNA
jgi:hypothetical protein